MFPGGYCAGLGIGGWLLMIGFWGVLIGVVLWAVARLFPSAPSTPSPEEPTDQGAPQVTSDAPSEEPTEAPLHVGTGHRR